MHKTNMGSDERALRSISALYPAISLQPTANEVVPDRQMSGFTGTCEITLIDWIQLIQMCRRDAVIGLLTHDGKVGTLWCRGGDIIDAACDGVTGEPAVYRALTWIGGRVSVAFTNFSRRRAILTPTTALLLRAAYKEDSVADELEQPQGLAAPLPDEPNSIVGAAIAVSPTRARWMSQRPPALLIGATCGFLALLLTVRLSSRGTFRSRRPNMAATTSLHDLPVLTAVTPGHAAAGRVGVGRSDVSAGVFEQINLVPKRPTNTNAVRKRFRATTAPQARGVAASSAINGAPVESASAPARVQIIEGRPPRIQIIDERGGHADVRD